MTEKPDNPAPHPSPVPPGCRPLPNLFEGTSAHDCFGCAQHHPHGLRLRFVEDGDRVVCRWKPDSAFQSWNGILHGGIIAAILDETAGWTVLHRFHCAAMTTRLDVKFLHPALVSDSFLSAAAWPVGRRNEKIVVLRATLSDSSGTLCAEAEADYYLMDPARSRAMGFPSGDPDPAAP